MTDQRDALIAHLLGPGRARILQEYHPDSCIVSTRIAVECLKAHGLEAWPQAVAMHAFNPTAAAHVEKREAFDYDEDGGYAVAVEGTGHWGPDSRGRRSWDAHLVAMFRDSTGEVMLDLSLDQATRPERDLVVHPIVFRVLGWPTGWKFENGCLVAYDRVPSRSYRQSPNWAQRSYWGEIVEEILDAVPPTSRVDSVTTTR